MFILASVASATPVHLRCEYLENPLGVDASTPHLSWQSDSSQRNWMQSAYQILVASNGESLRSGQADIWDRAKDTTGKSGYGTRPGKLRNRGKEPGGRWACSTARTGKRSGFVGIIPRMTLIGKGFAGFGCPVKMRLRLCRIRLPPFAWPSIFRRKQEQRFFYSRP